ncbi:ATP-dependent DNA helicase PIF1 [Microplitis mediator]|uniref:ATP-dependent DNA helicase PIF1 n=1 Tax=Microplitis mediator TaxID=375433 RepID=UPI0025569FA4|nr:ATP-dependent DNA helicase PIF1 [Microplitis mediator]
MESEGCFLNSTAVLEWTNVSGTTTRKVNYKSAQLRLIRNNLRQMLVQVQAEKSNTTFKLLIRGVNVLNRFMHEGKATIKFNEERCTLFISNAPAAQLTSFLKTIFVKMTGQPEAKVTSLKQHLAANVNLGGVQDISPATAGEIKAAKEKALTVAASRKTVTTPSPSNVRKRKLLNSENGIKVPVAKKLYSNPTVSELTEEQTQVLEAVLRGNNIFFTGSAGTGKSYLLKRIIGELPPDVTTITASTGVAACHIGGITLHQFAGIGLGNGTLERCYQLAARPSVAAVWRKTKHLIIDEISMVDGDLFDRIEAVARHIRRNDKPFGGIQLILCGDFFQLPPVKKNDAMKFCFESKVWDSCINCNFELQTVHRQKDQTFVKLLNSIRIGRVTDEIKEILKATAKQKIEKDGILATRLCSHVKEADEINESQLEKLEGVTKHYVAQDSDESMTKTLDQQLSVPGKLTLKIGAQVMLLKNINIVNGLVNGARGVVIRFDDEIPVVQFCSGEIYPAKSEKWMLKMANGSFIHRKQIPLKLAWAFSIHKSQGLTLDCVEMNLSNVFDAGQSYVALSRAQSLGALRVLDFNEKQVWVSTNVLEFYKKFRRNLHNMKIFALGKSGKTKRK